MWSVDTVNIYRCLSAGLRIISLARYSSPLDLHTHSHAHPDVCSLHSGRSEGVFMWWYQLTNVKTADRMLILCCAAVRLSLQKTDSRAHTTTKTLNKWIIIKVVWAVEHEKYHFLSPLSSIIWPPKVTLTFVPDTCSDLWPFQSDVVLLKGASSSLIWWMRCTLCCYIFRVDVINTVLLVCLWPNAINELWENGSGQIKYIFVLVCFCRSGCCCHHFVSFCSTSRYQNLPQNGSKLLPTGGLSLSVDWKAESVFCSWTAWTDLAYFSPVFVAPD